MWIYSQYLSIFMWLIICECFGISRENEISNEQPNDIKITNLDVENVGESLRNLSGKSNTGVSLAFVFDATGSMWDDLQELIKGATLILDAMNHKDTSPIANYILVPYRDPDVGPITVTNNDTVLKDALKKVEVYGGADCPEMALSAIILALNNSLPNSYIYIFSDATAKDYLSEKTVLDLVQRKKSQIFFVLTGDCGDRSKPAFKVYEQIAAASSGQVFNLKKNEVHKVLQYVEDILDNNRVNLEMKINSAGSNLKQKISVDNTLEKVTVSVSGGNPKIHIIDPFGEKIEGPPKIIKTLDLLDIQVINIFNPEPGNWTVGVTSDNSHSIKVTGVSGVNFKYGFFINETTKFHETSHRPLRGTYNNLMIAIEGNGTLNCTSIDVKDISGKSLFEIPLEEINSSDKNILYRTNDFLPPDDFFNIVVNGYDSDGNFVQRISTTALKAQDPEKPFISIEKEIYAYPNEDLLLTCKIESLVPITTWWLKNNKPINEKQQHLQSAEAKLIISNINENKAGTYVCKAMNIAGVSGEEVNVIIIGSPPQVSLYPQNIITVEGTLIELKCAVESILPITSVHLNFNDNMLISEKINFNPQTVEAKNNITTYSFVVVQNLTGIYMCEAENDMGKNYNATIVNVIPAMEIKMKTNKTVYEKGETFNITCSIDRSVEGHWKLPFEIDSNSVMGLIEHHVVFENNIDITLEIRNFSQLHEGKYICLATRETDLGIEKKNVTLELKLIEKVSVSVENRNVYINVGDQMSIDCTARGIPTPEITWIFPNQTKSITKDIFKKGELHQSKLIIENFQIENQGTYLCDAKNNFSFSEESIFVTATQKLSISTKMKNMTIKFFEPVTIDCGIVGLPYPKFKWFHNDNLLSNPNVSSHGDKLHIHAVNLEDEGIYRCLAYNEIDEMSDEAGLYITGDVPKLEVNPKNITLKNNKKTFIECAIDSILPITHSIIYRGSLNDKNEVLSVDIKKNAEGIVLSTEHFLVSRETVGLYTCEAANSAGTTSESTSIEILPPLEVIIKPNIINFRENDEITLMCYVNGAKFGLWLVPNDQNHFQSKATYKEEDSVDGVILTMTLEKASSDHNGTYTCVGIRGVGDDKETVNNTAEAIFVNAPWFHSNRSMLLFEMGSTALISCNASGTPAPSIVWLLPEDQAVRSSDIENKRIYMTPKSDLTIENIAESDQGQYICTASNYLASVEHEIFVSVWKKPYFDEAVKNETVEIYDSIDLICNVKGSPRPNITWYHDDIEVKREVNTADDGKLSISNIETLHGGKYSCFAENQYGAVSREIFVNVTGLEPPKIDKSSSILTIMAGDTAQVVCRLIAGKPYPIFKWKKNNFEIQNNDDFEILNDISSTVLKINKTSLIHEGNFSCIATNEIGEDIYNILVSVQSPPYFKENNSIYKNKLDILQGTDFVLDCDIIGQPIPVISWMKNDLPLIYSNRIHTSGHTNSQLVIEKFQENDMGEYLCSGKNLYGEINKTFIIDILAPPIIENSYTNTTITAIEGQIITLSCLTRGMPKPAINWFHNGNPITADQPKHLEIGNTLKFIANTTDSGIFTCEAFNRIGRVNQEFSLIVNAPPKIMPSDNIDVTISLGSNLFLECNAIGFPLPTIEWLFNNKKLVSTIRTLLDDMGHLSIYNVINSDSGMYACNAENVAGLSQKMYKVVILGAPIIVSNGLPSRIQLKSDMNNFNIPCLVEGTPTPSVIWLHDGNLVLNNIHYEVNLNGTLTLNYLNEHMNGIYSCRATNSEGNAYLEYEIEIIAQPEVLNEYNPINYAVEGTRIDLACPIKPSITPAHIEWFKGNLLVDSGKNKIYSIHNVSRNDASNYMCTAINEMGNVTAELIVLVNWLPVFFENSTREGDMHLKENDALTLDCKVDANPNAEIQWLKNNEAMNYSSDTLVVKSVQRRHAGEYSCSAKNSIGSVAKRFFVHVNAMPVIEGPKNSSLDVIVGRSVTLECFASGIPKPIIRWNMSFPSDWISDKNGSLLKSSNVSIHSDGVYICEAENSIGIATKFVTLNTLVPIQITAVQLSYNNQIENITYEVNLKENSSCSFTCVVSGKPSPNIHWLKNNEIVVVNTSQLEIEKITHSDNGKYTCVATNTFTTDEYDFVINVLVPPIANAETKTLPAIENHFYSLKCDVRGVPVPEKFWYKNGITIDNKSNSTSMEIGGKDGSLVFNKITRADSGNYTCISKNSAGELVIEHVVDVLYAPSRADVGDMKKYIVGKVNEDIHLECIFESNPKSTIRWFKYPYFEIKNGVPANFVLENDNQELTIRNALLSNTGNYSCFASNSVGITETNFVVEIMDPPVIESAINNYFRINDDGRIIVQIRKGIQLFCNTSGTPEPSITWYKDERELNNQYKKENLFISLDGRFLNIMDSYLDDSGNYSCQAKNIIGTANKNFLVKVVVPAEWSPWSQWTSCSVTCGIGYSQRKRTCSFRGSIEFIKGANVYSQNINSWAFESNLDKSLCLGNSIETRVCSDVPCKIDGGWDDWSTWTTCSVMCGFGIRKRFRSCSNPSPKFGGLECVGMTKEQEVCRGTNCSQWSPWSVWTPCSVTCGIGTQQRFRRCQGPPDTCIGDSIITASCVVNQCTEQYVWSSWSDWSSCTATCDIGHRKRTRNCTLDYVKVEPKKCKGGNVEIEQCINLPPCKIRTRETNSKVGAKSSSRYDSQKKSMYDSEHESENGSSEDFVPEEETGLPFITFSMPPVRAGIEEDQQRSNDGDKNARHLKKLVHPSLESSKKSKKYTEDDFSSLGSLPTTTGRKKLVKIMEFQHEQDSNEKEIYDDIDSIEENFYDEKCPNGYQFDEDEYACYDIDECKEMNLCHETQMCQNTPGSYKCFCAMGYQSDGEGKRCIDIDECIQNEQMCSHKCFNVPGSYLCTCPVGLTLSNDRKTCIAETPLLENTKETNAYVLIRN